MSIRKFKADYLFNGREFLSPDAVLITDGNGVVQEISNFKESGDDVEILEGIISPGFINTHCHLELSHMKNRISPGTGLVEFLTRVIKERNFQVDDIMQAMEMAEAEMYSSGVAAVGDICNTANSVLIKRNSKMSWFNFIEVIGFNENDAGARIDYASKIAEEFITDSRLADQHQTGANHTSVSPHAPYSVSEKLFSLINDFSADKIITIHNQESDAENQLYRNKSGQLFDLYKNLNIDAGLFKESGKTSLQTYLPWLNKVAAVILVHDTFTTAEDLVFINNNYLPEHAYFCICINANRYIQSTNPPLELLRQAHCAITLGTDSYASNTQLNILEEMKTIHREFPHIPLTEILGWATMNGAKALGMNKNLGSFEAGKQPGIVQINNINNMHVSANSVSTRLLNL